MKNVTIERLVYSWKTPGVIRVVLKEKDANRRLVIGVDFFVGDAIVHALEPLPSPRPLPHDLITALLTTFHAAIRHVVITDLREKMFYAKIVLDHSGGSEELDARPSDALALAIKMKAPIFVEEALFAKASAHQDISKFEPLSSLWPFSKDLFPTPGDKPSQQE